MTVLVHEDVDLPEEALTGTESREPVSIEPLFTKEELEKLEFATQSIMVYSRPYQIPTLSFPNWCDPDIIPHMLPPWVEVDDTGEKLIKYAVASYNRYNPYRQNQYPEILKIVSVPWEKKDIFTTILNAAAEYRRKEREKQKIDQEETRAQIHRGRSLRILDVHPWESIPQDPLSLYAWIKPLYYPNPGEMEQIAKKILTVVKKL